MHTDKTSAEKLAMSRALGAAFLSHQVEQLEKSVQRDGRGDGTRGKDYHHKDRHPGGRGRRGGYNQPAVASVAPAPFPGRGKRERNGKEDKGGDVTHINSPNNKTREREVHEVEEKEADLLILDASVLIHCLTRVKNWCRRGRQEILVVPLEALNTLDSLKKGNSSLAQKARAASRLLEAQVGSNPRIRVQRDDAFVPWDDINFKVSELSMNKHSESSPLGPPSPPPEWLRRTICCAQWEIRNASVGGNLTDAIPNVPKTLLSGPITPVSNENDGTGSSSSPIAAAAATPAVVDATVVANDAKEKERTVDQVERRFPPVGNENTKVALAVLNNGVQVPSETALHPPAGRYDRADGTLIRIWAQKAGMELLLVEPSAVPSSSPPEKKRGGGQDKRDYRDGGGGGRRAQDRRPSLVEKPIAIAIVNEQPAKNLRLLARGEKLDP